ncbi:MAG: leucyl aminopeptidase [Streptosporangiales bacterium]
MTNLALAKDAAASLDVDALVVGVTGTAGQVRVVGEDSLGKPRRKARNSALAETLTALAASTDVGAVTKVPAPETVPAPVVCAVGLGGGPDDEDAYDPEVLRRAAGAGVRALAGRSRVVVALPTSTAAEIEAVGFGALLGAYAFDRYRRDDPSRRAPVDTVLIAPGDGARKGAAQAALDRAESIAAGVALARDLINTTATDLHPADLADAAVRAGKEDGLKVQVLDEKALAKDGYGGLTGVGQGAANPPRLVRAAYTHPRAKRTIVLCGKGITFDSGGLSLKTGEGMMTMKDDMSGAAAVLGALVAIARLKPKVNVVGYLACAENMPGGAAQRPGDVLTTYGGTSVEVLNTDAEGRLVLADALGRALEDKPDLLLDVATLTGAQVVALGTRYFAVMARDGAARDRVVDAAGRAGESAWPMPLPPELRKTLDSDVADIANIARNRAAGMLVAGTFLADFVPDTQPWAHLDIAGPAWSDQVDGYTGKGGTGVAVRTFVELADELAAG